MAELKIKADSGGGTVSFKGPATTTSNAAVQLTLPVDDGTTGQYLKTDGSGALSWATVSSDLVGDTSPQLGGDLDTNSFEIGLDDSHKVKFGNDNDLNLYHDGNDAYMDNDTGDFYIRNGGSNANQVYISGKGGENGIVVNGDGGVDLYYDNSKKFETSSGGVEIADGNLYIECTAASPPSTSNDGAAFISSGTDSTLNSSSGSYTGLSNHFIVINGNGTVGSISANGSSTSYNTSSDYRLKENAVAISDGITRLKTLKPYRFNWKADANKTVDGFFAHEVSAVPEAVKGTKDAVADKDNATLGIKKDDPIYQQIDQAKLTPLLTAALQEAITKIETLETKVAALEAG